MSPCRKYDFIINKQIVFLNQPPFLLMMYLVFLPLEAKKSQNNNNKNTYKTIASV